MQIRQKSSDILQLSEYEYQILERKFQIIDQTSKPAKMRPMIKGHLSKVSIQKHQKSALPKSQYFASY